MKKEQKNKESLTTIEMNPLETLLAMPVSGKQAVVLEEPKPDIEKQVENLTKAVRQLQILLQESERRIHAHIDARQSTTDDSVCAICGDPLCGCPDRVSRREFAIRGSRRYIEPTMIDYSMHRGRP